MVMRDFYSLNLTVLHFTQGNLQKIPWYIMDTETNMQENIHKAHTSENKERDGYMFPTYNHIEIYVAHTYIKQNI